MNREHILPADIERTSMAIITKELEERGITVPEDRAAVVRRVIHTTADFDSAENLHFTEDAVAKAVKRLAQGGAVIITDTNMALSGVSKPSLKKLDAKAFCFMAEPEIEKQAKEQGTTRAVASMAYGGAHYPEAVFAVGNAPTALLKLEELIEEGLRPSLIIGVPVGFVNVVESKEQIFSVCEKYGIPAIVAFGRKGGSNVAAAITNALLYTATDTLDPGRRGWQG